MYEDMFGGKNDTLCLWTVQLEATSLPALDLGHEVKTMELLEEIKVMN